MKNILKFGGGCLGVIILGFFMILGLVLAIDAGTPESTTPRKPSVTISNNQAVPEYDVLEKSLVAYNVIEGEVLKRLATPATAKFPKPKNRLKHVTYLGDNNFRINSWVDAQNGYGAMVRSPWTALIHDEQNDSWSLLELSFNN